MKKIYKYTIIAFLLLGMSMVFPKYSLARPAGADFTSPGSSTSSGDTASGSSSGSSSSSSFDLSRFDEKGNSNIDGAAQSVSKTIINVIQIVGTATAIITLTYLGIKYMMSAPAEKAEFKKSLYIYIVGAFLVFASSNILAIIYKVAEDNL